MTSQTWTPAPIPSKSAVVSSAVAAARHITHRTLAALGEVDSSELDRVAALSFGRTSFIASIAYEYGINGFWCKEWSAEPLIQTIEFLYQALDLTEGCLDFLSYDSPHDSGSGQCFPVFHIAVSRNKIDSAIETSSELSTLRGEDPIGIFDLAVLGNLSIGSVRNSISQSGPNPTETYRVGKEAFVKAVDALTWLSTRPHWRPTTLIDYPEMVKRVLSDSTLTEVPSGPTWELGELIRDRRNTMEEIIDLLSQWKNKGQSHD